MTDRASNADAQVVADFGSEWSRFDQDELSREERDRIFDDYFHIFPWASLPASAVGMDVGCGSGRWANVTAGKVGRLHCVDASADALAVARRVTRVHDNVEFHLASVDALPCAPGSLDFAYSLGVLHHVPDTPAAIRSVAETLKPGAPMLLYLYYAFDNRPQWFRAVWGTTDVLRRGVSRLPRRLKNVVCDTIATFVYWPLARAATVLDRVGILPSSWPLSAYRTKSFYTMRTDALDRFGTRLEQRFSRQAIEAMMRDAGLVEISFSDRPPYWCAVGRKR